MPVELGHVRVTEKKVAADHQEDSHNAELDDHNRRVEVCRFLDPNHQNGGDHHDDKTAMRLQMPVTCGNPASITPGGSDILSIHIP